MSYGRVFSETITFSSLTQWHSTPLFLNKQQRQVMPKVSILVPVYGVEKYISKCAESLFSQTYSNIEYIFVDDCTPDKSIDMLLATLEHFPERKSQVSVIRHDRNKGLGAARATAFEASSGDYIIHADSDDFLATNCVETLVGKALENDADIVDGAYCEYSESETGKPHFPYHGNTETLLKMTLCHNIVKHQVWARLYRRTLLANNGIESVEGIDYCEDFVITPLVLFHAKRTYTDNIVYYYRTDNSSSYTHHISEKNVISFLKACDLVVTFFENNDKVGRYATAIDIEKVNVYREAKRNGFSIEKTREYFNHRICNSFLRKICEMIECDHLSSLANKGYLAFRRIYKYSLKEKSSSGKSFAESQAHKKKVFHIIAHLDVGGAEKVAMNIARSNTKDFEYHIVEVVRASSNYTDNMKEALRHSGIAFHHFIIPDIRFHYLAQRLAAYIFPLWFYPLFRKYRPDVIHCHTEIPELATYCLFRMFPSLSKKCKVVRTIHNTRLWSGMEKTGKTVETWLKSMKANVSISPSVSKSYLFAYGESPSVIFNGVAPVTKKLTYKNLRKGKVNILFAGRFEEQKGIENLISIIKEMQTNADYFFHIIGDGRLKDKIFEELDTLDNVEISAPLSNLASYLNSFDYLLMPSLHEGLSILSIEASMEKLPVIANDCAGLADTLPSHWPLLAHDNSMTDYRRIFNEVIPGANYATLAKEAFAFASCNFSIEKMQKAYEDVYGK